MPAREEDSAIEHTCSGTRPLLSPCVAGGLHVRGARLCSNLVRALPQSSGCDDARRIPFIRQWILLRTLAARKYGAAVKELAQEAGVSVKTIRRDLKTFQAAHFPLKEVVGDFGRKKMIGTHD